MKFSFINNTVVNADADVYWAILGQNSDGDFVHVQSDGTVKVISTDDNTNPINGQNYANYSTKLSDASSVEITGKMVSGRVYFSIGDWLPIQVHSATAYAPPTPSNPSVPGYYTIFDIFEFTYEPDSSPQMHCNTSSVDFMGIPITAVLKSSDDPKEQRVGYTVSRDALTSDFSQCANGHFSSLLIPGQNSGDPILRILSPEHASGLVMPQEAANYFNTFFDHYITDCWNYYKEPHTLTLNITSSMYNGPVTGQVDEAGKNFVFYEGTELGGTQVLSLAKPSTKEVFSCNGVFDTGNELQKDIQKFIAAAINRTVMIDSPGVGNWCGAINRFYIHAPVELYAKILHDHSIRNMCYAFAYDDVCNQSSSLVSNGTAEEVVFTLTAWTDKQAEDA